MVNKLFQTAIQQMSNAIDKTFGVIDTSKTIVVCNELSRIGEQLDITITPTVDGFTDSGYTLKPITSAQGDDYIVFVEGTDTICSRYAHILCVMFTNIKNYYDAKYNLGNFVKDIILDNILQGDIYNKARKLHFNSEVARAVLIIRTANTYDVAIHEALQNIFPEKNKDFVINVTDNEVALVKEIGNSINNKDIENLAMSISENLVSEFNINTVIGIGSTVTNLNHLARSFKEAQTALEVSKVFDEEKRIISYDNLGIARLVYQLPTTLCDTFFNEVFKRGTIDNLDEETLFTVRIFFENNLNVSETARRLYLHRNTLLYRIEKVKKITGLDLKKFDHAAIFKIALMVNKYLKSSPNKF